MVDEIFGGLREVMELVKVVIFGMDGVGVGRNGLILWENDGAGSWKVFRWLRGLWEPIQISKIAPEVQKCKNTVNYCIFY